MSFIEGTGSGSTAFAEIQNRIAQARQDRFATADQDGSGGLSLEEFEAGAAESPLAGRLEQQGISAGDKFSELDADGDGELTQSELEAANPFKNGTLSPDMVSMMLSLQEGGGFPPPPGGGALDLNSLFSSDDDEDEEDGSVDTAQNPIDVFLDALTDVTEGGAAKTYETTA